MMESELEDRNTKRPLPLWSNKKIFRIHKKLREEELEVLKNDEVGLAPPSSG